jgi:hypothetical protein
MPSPCNAAPPPTTFPIPTINRTHECVDFGLPHRVHVQLLSYGYSWRVGCGETMVWGSHTTSPDHEVIIYGKVVHVPPRPFQVDHGTPSLILETPSPKLIFFSCFFRQMMTTSICAGPAQTRRVRLGTFRDARGLLTLYPPRCIQAHPLRCKRPSRRLIY